MTTPTDAPAPARTRTVESGGVRLHVEEWGEPGSPPVVLVHGYPDTTSVWQRVVPRLSADHHVVAYDVRGAGRSSRPSAVGAYAFTHLVADLEAVVEATSPDAPVHLVGHDWGAIQGWEVVTDSRTAALVSGFTAISAPSLDLTGHWARRRLDLRGAPALAAQLLRSWYIAAFQLPGLAPAVWRAGLGDRWADLRRRVEADPELPAPAPTVEQDGVCGIRLYRANAGRVTRPRRDEVHVPTTVLVGAADRFVGPALFADLPTDRVRVQVVRGGRHWLPLTHADAVADVVRDQVAGTD